MKYETILVSNAVQENPHWTSMVWDTLVRRINLDNISF